MPTSPIIVTSNPEIGLNLPKPSPSCQAVFFYYACGCRAPKPIFCCQPYPNAPQQQIYANNPCQHKTPSVIIAKLPHSCKAEIGNTEACRAEDPAAKEFVREVDTAERLDLATFHIPSVDVDKTLPKRIDGDFTAGQVALRALTTRKNPPTFRPDALPFVPRSTAPIDPHDVGNTFTDSTKKDIGHAEKDGKGQPDGKSVQSDGVTGEETVRETTQPEEVTQPDDGESSEGSDEFFDIETPPTSEYAASESTTSRAEQTVASLEEPEPRVESGSSYDDMMMLWALEDDQAARQTTKTYSWSISSLLGSFCK
ncbi:hypothetical protein F4803DRAFT_85922 [Xylaria telfairii]|nr:hypothetical protein F4803DRAFT_85922 [Xylaria telfairii]